MVDISSVQEHVCPTGLLPSPATELKVTLTACRQTELPLTNLKAQQCANFQYRLSDTMKHALGLLPYLQSPQ